MPPQSVRVAAWLLAAATVVYGILIPGGMFAFNALHGPSRGESPLLSVMALGFGLLFLAPRLLLSALVYFKILQGRNWARVLFLLLTGIALYTALQSFRLAILFGARALPGWFLFEGAAAFLYLAGAVLLFSETANGWFRGERTET